MEGLENTVEGDPTDDNMDEVTRNAIRMFCTLFGQETSRYSVMEPSRLNIPKKVMDRINQYRSRIPAGGPASRQTMGVSNPTRLNALIKVSILSY